MTARDHFEPALFEFLIDLSLNNHREWFNENKQRYEDDVRTPALSFIEVVGTQLGRLSPHLVAVPKKSGGSMMRIFRDTRFSKDKTPYKTNVGIQFRHERGKDVHAPGLYVHLDPDEVFIAVGMWRPASDELKAIRAKIDAEQARWSAIASDAALLDVWRPAGDALKRAPKGYAADHPLIDELRRKDFILVFDGSHEDVTTPGFADRVLDRAVLAADYAQFLCEAIDAPW